MYDRLMADGKANLGRVNIAETLNKARKLFGKDHSEVIGLSIFMIPLFLASTANLTFPRWKSVSGIYRSPIPSILSTYFPAVISCTRYIIIKETHARR